MQDNAMTLFITVRFASPADVSRVYRSSSALHEELHQYVIYDAKPRAPRHIKLDDPPANTYTPPTSLTMHLSKIPIPELCPPPVAPKSQQQQPAHSQTFPMPAHARDRMRAAATATSRHHRSPAPWRWRLQRRRQLQSRQGDKGNGTTTASDDNEYIGNDNDEDNHSHDNNNDEDEDHDSGRDEDNRRGGGSGDGNGDDVMVIPGPEPIHRFIPEPQNRTEPTGVGPTRLPESQKTGPRGLNRLILSRSQPVVDRLQLRHNIIISFVLVLQLVQDYLI
ncbi:hypothetical protein EDB85DRAFT_1898889 [Lactarius pseudohatsudake]|nr:hypothetical protein EDB85DRAFT_1898889 [Lactarius pseudohatsudake]